jgi:predicted glutamine amidotransferase
MCRLFGMSGGDEPVRATFWLLGAPDSLATQSRREPDGTGIGWFGETGTPSLAKQPIAAFEDRAFATEAQTIEAHTFVAHVRFSSGAGLTIPNTHPFQRDGRLFAHNGVIGDTAALESELGPDVVATLAGETDSERWFALISREITRADGDVAAGIASATRWIAGNLPLLSANFVMIENRELWALRYPATHELHVLEREAGGGRGEPEPLRHVSSTGHIHASADTLAHRPSVIVATEPMDDDPDWRAMDSGELLHVGADLTVSLTTVIAEPPAHPLTMADLTGRAAQSQSEPAASE